MSQWTHVVGCIRIDGIQGMHSLENVRRQFGPMCLYDDWNDASTLPRGSEGSLRFKIIEYDDGLPWLCIPIWGDLRDYNNIEEIKQWWEKLLALFESGINGIVRDAILRIEVEYGDVVILQNKREDK